MTAVAAKGRPPMFSRTRLPQSAFGGCNAPRPKERPRQQHDEDEAQAEVGEHRAGDVRRDLVEDQVGVRFARGRGRR